MNTVALPSSGELMPQSFLFAILENQISAGNIRIIVSFSQLCQELRRKETEVHKLLQIHANRSWQSEGIIAYTHDMVGDVCGDVPVKHEGVPDTQVLDLSNQVVKEIYDLKMEILDFVRDRGYELDDPSGLVLIDLGSDMTFVKKSESPLLMTPDIRALGV